MVRGSSALTASLFGSTWLRRKAAVAIPVGWVQPTFRQGFVTGGLHPPYEIGMTPSNSQMKVSQRLRSLLRRDPVDSFQSTVHSGWRVLQTLEKCPGPSIFSAVFLGQNL